jgi:uncharacterized protein YbaA (DUF1428 family)
MSYFDGFILAVPKANRDKFISHAAMADPMFIEMGATQVLECWEDDVQDGSVTDFRRAVQATGDEAVCFSWIEWPDKATRDAAMAKMMDPNNTDERMDPTKNPMPFDGKRMIFGGFAPLLDTTLASGKVGYVDGCVIPVPDAKRDAYRTMAETNARTFADCGAIRVCEAWGDDVPDGKVTDLRRAVQAQEGESVAFTFFTWPDKATRDAGWAKMMEQGPPPGEMPFDGKRMFWGGFTPVVTL